ncbi:MAG: exodeoxyribonuclease VII small subunit [Clostridia bacterium]|nr:exodeoxyribonuclease VII small subunit [Clostridia bacterium]
MSEKKEMTFEEMLKRLEEIVRALDNVETPLETSLALFEEGACLVRLCSEKLDQAQQKVTILTSSPDGVTEEDFQAAN